MTRSTSAGCDPGGGERLAAGVGAHRGDALLGPGDAAVDDAGALADPLVAGVEPRFEVGVGQPAGRAVLAEPEEAGLDGPNAHAMPPARLRHGVVTVLLRPGDERAARAPPDRRRKRATRRARRRPAASTGCSARELRTLPSMAPGR